MMLAAHPRDAPDTDAYTRLHIAPFDPDLLQTILPAAVQPRARAISFHGLQTFPERRYGFVELPVADAEKIKKKLNGAVVKGTKIRIERARADKMPKPSEDALADPDAAAKKDKRPRDKDKKKKRKRDPEELAGVELEEGRRVKRGWTVSPEELKARKKDKKHKGDKGDKKEKKKEKKHRETKSKYTDGPECLVKTRLPPNKADMADALGESGLKKRKQGSGNTREVVVHEFEKTTKFPSFLRNMDASSTVAKPTEYVEGKGWVDGDGNVLEPVKTTRPAVTLSRPTKAPRTAKPPADEEDDTSSSGSSSESEEADDDGSMAATGAGKEDSNVTRTSSSEKKQTPAPVAASEPSRPVSSSSARGLTIAIPPPPTTPAAVKVHPLEVLYKRTKDGNAPEHQTQDDAKPFTFFNADDIEGEDEDEGLAPAQVSQPPTTPYTQQELEWRTVRSAAPTPDTAHPSRAWLWLTGDEEDELDKGAQGSNMGSNVADGADDMDVDAADERGNVQNRDGGAAPGDFQSWFWEHRGDLNRSWKNRRRLAAKAKRYRENRARAERAI